MPAPIVSTGTTVSFGTSGFAACILSVTPPNLSVESLDTSCMTTTGYKTFIPAKLIDGGELSMSIQFDPAIVPVIGVTEEITITFPDGTTWVFDGFATGFAPSADLETVMTATLTVKVANDVTVTAAP